MNDRVSTISVIVRSMARPSLGAALASIAAQDFPAIEVVVVAACGASHPPLPEVCGLHPLRVVTSALPLSRPRAGNAGLGNAGGDWITFLDDDDVFLPGHLSSLMAARSEAPDAGLIYSYARGVMNDGRSKLVGQPHSLMQLYERNYIHLSAAMFERDLVAEGCHFDESFESLQDWDFFLQAAQRTSFHFVPLQLFEWHAEVGSSGSGGGNNADTERFILFRDRIYAKWEAARNELVERVSPYLQLAGDLAQDGQWAEAERQCRAALSVSPNDPWALNTLAMIRQGVKDFSGARATQELAVTVRPLDASLVFNLATLCHKQGDIKVARRCCDRAMLLDPDFAPAKRLHATLSSTPSWLNRGSGA